jgi:NTE family protein
MNRQRPKAIELALSGGGVRAMAFHCGLLQFLGEQNALERIEHISSVSGGSLLVGLVFHKSAMRWPSSAEYLDSCLPSIREELTRNSLQLAAVRQLLLPWNWCHVFSRANLVAHAIRSLWGIGSRLSDLPAMPLWSINGTTAETGRRFRFKSGACGDYELGYTDASAFSIADVLAVSAAFPGAIGPLSVESSRYKWRKRTRWNDPISEEREVTLPFKTLHLYDGGLYDNLGMEPLFDIGRQVAKVDGTTIIVSDAGAPLIPGFAFGVLNPFRMKRWLALTRSQQRALRIRSFVNALQKGLPGAYLQMGARATNILAKVSAPRDARWLGNEEAAAAAAVPTSLEKLTPATFNLLARHGYETAYANNLAYPYL